MLRLPSTKIAVSGLRATIHELPDEILLNISAQFTGLSRNRDLVNLALVSRKWRMAAQEWLLKEPRFNITCIYKYMWELGHRARLLGQVKRLEIWSTSEGRIQYDDNGRAKQQGYQPAQASQEMITAFEFAMKCTEIMRYFALNEAHRRMWSRALSEDVVPALFGILICTLSNLEELRLGHGWLIDFPVFSNMLTREANSFIPRQWMHGFLAGPLDQLYSRLTVLEVPVDMTTLFFFRTSAVFDFRPFQHLREIGITMKALYFNNAMRRYRSLDPREIFPPTLEILKISEATYNTVTFLKNLCAAKKGGHYPSLRRVEVYYMEILNDRILASAKRYLIQVEELRKSFQTAELELYLYFPKWRLLKTWQVGGTPWQLKEERLLLAAEMQAFHTDLAKLGHRVDAGRLDNLALQYPPFETEWDKDGDVVMA